MSSFGIVFWKPRILGSHYLMYLTSHKHCPKSSLLCTTCSVWSQITKRSQSDQNINTWTPPAIIENITFKWWELSVWSEGDSWSNQERATYTRFGNLLCCLATQTVDCLILEDNYRSFWRGKVSPSATGSRCYLVTTCSGICESFPIAASDGAKSPRSSRGTKLGQRKEWGARVM